MARDWLKSLWPASYKGVKFWVREDEEEGGRRIVIHQFPMRDDPFLEDLGEDKRGFDVTAYVASDTADDDAAAVISICATRGAGALVLPTHGPIIVRCLTFKRERSKDRHGYIALSLTFVREGAPFALATASNKANMVFVNAEAAAAQIAMSFAEDVQTRSMPEFVREAISDSVLDALSILEVIRTTEPVDVEVSAAQRVAIQSLFDAAPGDAADASAVGELATGIVAIVRNLGDGIPAAASVAAFEQLMTDPSLTPSALPAYATYSAEAAALNAEAVWRTLRLSLMTAYAEAIARVALPDRPSALTLRANVVEHFEAELEAMPASRIDLFHSIAALRDTVVDYLSRVILDLAPVMTVEANVSLPSLYWAWRLYQDPNRSAEVVARNRIAHPSIMPLSFEALAK